MSRSCCLASLDYYLWGAIKEKCYAGKIETIEHLKINIRDDIAEIWPHILEKVHKNFSE